MIDCPKCRGKNIQIQYFDDDNGREGEAHVCEGCGFIWDEDLRQDCPNCARGFVDGGFVYRHKETGFCSKTCWREHYD